MLIMNFTHKLYDKKSDYEFWLISSPKLSDKMTEILNPELSYSSGAKEEVICKVCDKILN